MFRSLDHHQTIFKPVFSFMKRWPDDGLMNEIRRQKRK